MFYAQNRCEFKDCGDGLIAITGPYVDRFGEHTVHVDARDLEKCMSGANVQDVLFYLSSDDREFLMSGLSPNGWDDATLYEEEE